MQDNLYTTEESNRMGMLLLTIYKSDHPIGSLLTEPDSLFLKNFKTFLIQENGRYREQETKRERTRQDERKSRRDDEDIPVGG